MTILDEIAGYARQRAKEKRKAKTIEEYRFEAAMFMKKNFSFEAALKKDGISFICECKKASPSKGVISENFDYMSIAMEYDKAGADAISVLTEPKWFLGKKAYLAEISGLVSAPCLRKDFIVDEVMIYESVILGASAVLLICSILSKEELANFIRICDNYGLSALVEAHDENEIKKALECGARIIGVNNRNLKDFSVDIDNSKRLRSLVPEDVIFVAESGIRNADDIKKLESIGVDAVLIGETLMRATDKAEKLKELKGIKT